MSALPEPGVVSLPSPHDFDGTTARVVRVLEHAGMTIFTRIDQQSAAEAVGLAMRPMMLVLFGNPKAGTPLMQAHPTLAIDLPLKALIWEDAHGQVWVLFIPSKRFLRVGNARGTRASSSKMNLDCMLDGRIIRERFPNTLSSGLGIKQSPKTRELLALRWLSSLAALN